MTQAAAARTSADFTLSFVLNALVQASRESVILLYGATGLLLIAAGVEAFWSSARWIPHSTKYAVAAVCWMTVFAYFIGQGRRAD